LLRDDPEHRPSDARAAIGDARREQLAEPGRYRRDI
jgi:hypothetical protein